MDIEKKALKMNAMNIAKHYIQYGDDGMMYRYTIRKLLELSGIEIDEEDKKSVNFPNLRNR